MKDPKDLKCSLRPLGLDLMPVLCKKAANLSCLNLYRQTDVLKGENEFTEELVQFFHMTCRAALRAGHGQQARE